MLVFLLLIQVASVSCGVRGAAACLWPVLAGLKATTIAVEITPRLVLVGGGSLLLSSAHRRACSPCGG